MEINKKEKGILIGVAVAVVVISVIVLIVVLSGGGSGLSGTWEHRDGSFITFSGKSFTIGNPNYDGLSVKGTYSITDDKIELIVDGEIGVESFSRTENTITIGRETFTRRR